jgi:hypothetical protein
MDGVRTTEGAGRDLGEADVSDVAGGDECGKSLYCLLDRGLRVWAGGSSATSMSTSETGAKYRCR